MPLLTTLLGTVPAQGLAASPDATIIPRLTGGPAVLLGTGYDTQARAFRARCVTGDVIYEGAPTSRLDLEHTIRVSDTFDEYGFTLAAGLDLGIASAMIGQRIALLTSDDQLTRSLVYSSDIRGKTAKLINLRLTDEGRRARAKNDPQFARALCGDEFVQRVDLGALLLLNARLEFRDSTNRVNIEEFLTLSFAMFSTTASFSQHTEDIKESTTITVDGVQFGGDPPRLEDLLAQVRTRTCTLRTADQCADVIDRLVAYASQPDGLQAQLDDLKYDGAASSARAYHASRYEAAVEADVVALGTPPILTRDAVAAIATMADRERVTLQLEARAEALLGGHLRPAQRADLPRFIADADDDIRTLGNAIDACYVDPGSCAASSVRVLQSLHAPSRERLVLPVTTYDVCLRAGSSTTADTAGLRAIGALARAVGMSVRTWDSTSCAALESSLDAAGSLDLQGSNLTDLAALRGILNLRSLQLRDNLVGGIDALSWLTDLEVLDLTNNQVGNLFPLYELRNLRQLHAGYNRVRTLAGVEPGSWPSLELAALHGNMIDSFAPLEGRAGLTLIRTVDERCDLERNRVVDLHLVDAAAAADLGKLGLAPSYRRPRDPASGIERWALCDVIANTY